MKSAFPTVAANSAPTLRVAVDGEDVAYRRLGPSAGIPLLMCNRLRGTLDHWDPLFLDTLAARRPVILFDSRGVGRSYGTAPDEIGAMARFLKHFVDALDLDVVDVFGWSMGGAVAQSFALQFPGSVRRLVLAGTGPGGVPDAPQAPARVWEVAGRPVNDDEDFLYLFFADTLTSRAAGRAHLSRLTGRSEPFGPQVKPESVRAQMMALGKWGKGVDSAYARLPELRHPILVANGVHDVMVHAYNSYAMAQRLPNAELVLYPDAGHGFHSQYPERFGRHVHDFLERAA